MRSLTLKLTLAFLVVSLIGVALVAVLIRGITSIEFNRFLTDQGLSTFTTAATNYYKAHGTWTGVADSLRQQGLVSIPAQNGGSPDGGPGQNGAPPLPFILVDATGHVLVASGHFHEGDTLPVENFQQNATINVNNQVVGYVLVTGRPPGQDPAELRFQTRTNEASILAALGAVVIAVLLGLLLARTITRPVKELTAASGAMARGRMGQQVPVRSKDELGELTRTFNTMSADLERANHARKQMTADIAHDLRTPLAVITGYLEGLKDGVIKPSSTRFESMYDEAIYLQRLVEDLRTLSLADAGELSMNRQPTQPGEIIQRLAAAFQHQAEQNQIELKSAVEKDLPAVNIDPERMQQALGNLVSNAIRYTPAGGKIFLSARREDGQIKIEVKDTGAGIPTDVLPHIFDRFFRGDDSRQEEGSGLGLAIARSIVELEGGKITASSQGPGTGSPLYYTGTTLSSSSSLSSVSTGIRMNGELAISRGVATDICPGRAPGSRLPNCGITLAITAFACGLESRSTIGVFVLKCRMYSRVGWYWKLQRPAGSSTSVSAPLCWALSPLFDSAAPFTITSSRWASGRCREAEVLNGTRNWKESFPSVSMRHSLS